MDWNDRLSILKELEIKCYSVCFYLLQCEKQACRAAQHVLLRLAQSDSFFHADPQTRQRILRSESMKCSLTIKEKQCHTASLQ
ncbi:hypothetical protein DQG23_03260 [Paenibacillus contaminans]|uniref:Uncharacterized protein n=1 Tax=Paenibacillus contaminans TaxID=450362 RepID=A0A329MV85_9BACL|nr:hypothetical protein DQG23_03260 [Paenibacillus contaminans]